jgi:hypothetical protein
LQVIITYAHDLGIEVLEFFKITLEREKLLFSDRGKSCKIKGKDHVLLTLVIRQLYLTLRRN